MDAIWRQLERVIVKIKVRGGTTNYNWRVHGHGNFLQEYSELASSFFNGTYNVNKADTHTNRRSMSVNLSAAIYAKDVESVKFTSK